MLEARLKPKEDRRLLRGHKWAYRNEFARLPEASDGDVVDVLNDRGRFVGRGFYQESGGIAVRLLSSERRTLDKDFLADRIGAALNFRRKLYSDETVYRWIFGESDGLSGLVVDRYGTVAIGRSACSFYEGVSKDLSDAILASGGVDTFYLYTPDGGCLRFGETVTLPIRCEVKGLVFDVNPDTGQKTGLFLDQRENWSLMRRFAKGASVLDAHCYTGAWSLCAAKSGAKSVLGVDTSAPAIDAAQSQAGLNGVADVCRFERADVREILRRDETYDLVLLDPPALAKGRASLRKALGLYRALNRAAMERLKPGGVLITSSCSQAVDHADFLETLKRAANAAQRQAQVLMMRGAAPDHPVLLSMPETSYLKCVVLRVD